MQDSVAFLLTPALCLERDRFESEGYEFTCDDGESRATVRLAGDSSALWVAVALLTGRTIAAVGLTVRTPAKERFVLAGERAAGERSWPQARDRAVYRVRDLPDLPALHEVAMGAVWSVSIRWA
ncbi:MAG: hypothetical protein KDE27_15145 [Planctomycetes bacterium]|nr:hypothetical protein [Planctomycetota bacterium]